MKHSKSGYALVIAAGVICVMAFGANAHAQITLSFDTLPSAQGWTYRASAGAPSEASVFSVGGGVLTQNALSGYYHVTYYLQPDVVDPNLPFTISVRARVLAESGASGENSWGFMFTGRTVDETFGIGLGTHRIEDNESRVLSTTIDNTSFHNYRLEATPGIGYSFYVDDVWIADGPPRTAGSPFENMVAFGDGTAGTGAHAEITAFTFDQTVDPMVAVNNLVEDVLNLNLHTGISNSLDAKLDSALSALDDLNENNDVAAINSLQAFINAVEAQRGHKIPEADADDLIAVAQAIIDYLVQ